MARTIAIILVQAANTCTLTELVKPVVLIPSMRRQLVEINTVYSIAQTDNINTITTLVRTPVTGHFGQEAKITLTLLEIIPIIFATGPAEVNTSLLMGNADRHAPIHCLLNQQDRTLFVDSLAKTMRRCILTKLVMKDAGFPINTEEIKIETFAIILAQHPIGILIIGMIGSFTLLEIVVLAALGFTIFIHKMVSIIVMMYVDKFPGDIITEPVKILVIGL